jgi:SAM-dependent methyltransferase
MTEADPKNQIQADLYRFPYHYLPALDEQGTVSIHKFVYWGLDYLTYMTFITHLIDEQIKPGSLLDVGCGDGRLLNMLFQKVPNLVGVDPVEQSILFAKAFNPGIQFYVGDATQVPGIFDAITLIEVLEHIPVQNMPDFIDTVAEKLAPGGKLILSVPTTNVKLNRKHYHHYDSQLIKQHLAPRFIVECSWFLTKQGLFFSILEQGLQNPIGIILSGKWRRLVWRLHKRFTYMAMAHNGRHLVAVARIEE